METRPFFGLCVGVLATVVLAEAGDQRFELGAERLCAVHKLGLVLAELAVAGYLGLDECLDWGSVHDYFLFAAVQ